MDPKNCDFRQITCYISKTVQDRHILCNSKQEIVCSLSNGDITDDLQ